MGEKMSLRTQKRKKRQEHLIRKQSYIRLKRSLRYIE